LAVQGCSNFVFTSSNCTGCNDTDEMEGEEEIYPAALFRARAAVLTTSPFATTACQAAKQFPQVTEWPCSFGLDGTQKVCRDPKEVLS
jgi:hypothetical protein